MTVEREQRGRVLVVNMRREEKRNAISPAMTAGIDAALNQLEEDPELWVGVLAGATSIFSAGTDLKESSGGPTERGGEYGRAHALGLVNVVTEPGAALDEALQLAERICANAPVPVRESLRAVERVVAATDEAAWETTEEAIANVVASEDIGEGLAAFFERRAPRWSGR